MKSFNKNIVKSLLSCLFLFGITAQSFCSKGNTKNNTYLKESISDIKELKEDDIKIPEYVFNHAKGILVLNNFKASLGLGFGGTSGIGFKKLNNTWGPVAFYKGPGLSIGFQIGASSNSIIMMLMNDEGLKLLQGKNAKFSGDLKATAGPQLVDASTKNNADVYVYSTGGGLELGASIGLEKLSVDYKKMRKYYNDQNISDEYLNDILDGKYSAVKNISSEKMKEFFNQLEELKQSSDHKNKPVEK